MSEMKKIKEQVAEIDRQLKEIKGAAPYITPAEYVKAGLRATRLSREKRALGKKLKAEGDCSPESCSLCSDLLAALKVAEEQLTKAEDELRGLGGDDGACEVGILACRMAISQANA